MTLAQRDAQFAKSIAESASVAPAIGLGAMALSAPVAFPVAVAGRFISKSINNSRCGKEFSYIDLTVAGATSFATTGISLLPSLHINTLGAYGG